ADAVGGFEALLEPGAEPAGADIGVSVEPALDEPSPRPALNPAGRDTTAVAWPMLAPPSGHVQDVAGGTKAIEHPQEPAADALPAPIGVLADAGPETDAVQEAEEAVIAEVEVDLSDAIGQLRAGIKPDAIAGTADAASAPAVPTGDLERVFELFRDEVAALGLADAGAQHLKLAMTYRDMGMISDCIRSLEVAARSPRHRFEAASGLAQTYRDQGRIREAVEWFERAAEAPAPSADAGRRLLYDLGQTLSDGGESERALAVFLELQADAPEYRDVAAWVRRLSSTS
ncbi:MAG: tetratricopeptide repeat protein, partial [Acidobacteria bacterium]|nr:tetratricopeptide repeat protein [Acidobacteriota bacterium]